MNSSLPPLPHSHVYNDSSTITSPSQPASPPGLPSLIHDTANDLSRPYSAHYERIDFVNHPPEDDLAWLSEERHIAAAAAEGGEGEEDALRGSGEHESEQQEERQATTRLTRRGLDLGLTGSDFNATLTGGSKTATARFARRLRPIVSRALREVQHSATANTHTTKGNDIRATSKRGDEEDDGVVANAAASPRVNEQRLLSRSAEDTLWGRSHDRIAALQETLRGTGHHRPHHPLLLLTGNDNKTQSENDDEKEESSTVDEQQQRQLQLQQSMLLEAGLDSVTQRTQRALARLYAKDTPGAAPAFGPRKAHENNLRATLAFLTQQQQELADRNEGHEVKDDDENDGIRGAVDGAHDSRQAFSSSPHSKPNEQQQSDQQQQSLRFEPLTMSAIRRRFGPPAMLSLRVAPSVVSVLSVCSQASSLLRDEARREDKEGEDDYGNSPSSVFYGTRKGGKAGVSGSPLYAQGNARQAMRRYVGYLHTPDSVLRELAQKAQPAKAHTNNSHNTARGRAPQRPRAKLCATMPFLNETLRDTRVLHAAKQAIVLDKIGVHKSGQQVVQDAMQATQALLRNHQQRRSSQERLMHEVRQWCDRTVLSTTSVPQGRYGTATAAAAPLIVVEEDPNEMYERDMRRIALEEAEVRMRNLLQRRRRLESQPGHQSLLTGSSSSNNNSKNKDNSSSNNKNSAVRPEMAGQIDLQDHRRLCARFTPWGTSAAEEEAEEEEVRTAYAAGTHNVYARGGEVSKAQSTAMSPRSRPAQLTYLGADSESSTAALLTSAEEGLLTLAVFALSRAGSSSTIAAAAGVYARSCETSSLARQLHEALRADQTAAARRRSSFSSSAAANLPPTQGNTPTAQENTSDEKKKEKEDDMLGYVYLKGVGDGHDLRCLRELDSLLLRLLSQRTGETSAPDAPPCTPRVIPVTLHCSRPSADKEEEEATVGKGRSHRTSKGLTPSPPPILSRGRQMSCRASPCDNKLEDEDEEEKKKEMRCVRHVDAMELLYALPAVTVQALLEQTRGTAQGGSVIGPGGLQLSLSRSVRLLWRRVLHHYLLRRRSSHHTCDDEDEDEEGSSGAGKEEGARTSRESTTKVMPLCGAAKDELRVTGFSIDLAAALATSRWRTHGLKRQADALYARLQAAHAFAEAAAAAAVATAATKGASRVSPVPSSPATPTPSRTNAEAQTAMQRDGMTRDPPRRYEQHHPSMMGLLSYGMETEASSLAHKASIVTATTSAEQDDESASAMVGPQMIHDIPFAPATRACYPLDMRNLYVRATLAAEECDGALRTRLERLVQRYRELCASITSADTTSKGSEVGMSLATNLQRWAAVQQLYDLEASYAQALSTFYEHECTVHEFNAHVAHYNAFQLREGRIWGPLYRSSLCISYLLCKYLSLHGLEQLPEDYVALLHPVALFLGCSGGHREIRVKLPERMVDILERAKRVRLHLESMPWKAQEERQLAEAVRVVGQCGQPARIVTCLATEEDVLFVPLAAVTGPQRRFTALPGLA